jgi:hypothetical protein
MKKRILLFLSLGILVKVVAQDKGPIEGKSFYIDQNFLPALGTGSDKNYTMGLSLKYSNTIFFNSGLSQALWTADNWLKSTLLSKDAHDTSIPVGSGFYMLSGNGFTPNNINTSER